MIKNKQNNKQILIFVVLLHDKLFQIPNTTINVIFLFNAAVAINIMQKNLSVYIRQCQYFCLHCRSLENVGKQLEDIHLV